MSQISQLLNKYNAEKNKNSRGNRGGGGTFPRKNPAKGSGAPKSYHKSPRLVTRQNYNNEVNKFKNKRQVESTPENRKRIAAFNNRGGIVDVYPSSRSGGGSRGSSGGGYSRPSYSYGGRSYNSQGAYMAAVQKAQEAAAAAERKRQEALRQKQLQAARNEAKKTLDYRLKVIDAAIKNAKNQGAADVADWTRRGQNAQASLSKVYDTLVPQAQAMNTAATGAIQAHGQAANQGNQSLIDAITGRNEQTEQGLAEALGSMGFGDVLQKDQVQASEALSLAEMLARSQQANTGANYGLQQGAQQVIGDWNVQGLGSDKARGVSENQQQVNGQIATLQETLANLLKEQELQKQTALGQYDSTIAGLRQ